MVYGYDCKTLNEFGLKEMREVSIAASPDALRALASFLVNVATEMESAASEHWHAHCPGPLRHEIGCDVIVLKWEAQAEKEEEETGEEGEFWGYQI